MNLLLVLLKKQTLVFFIMPIVYLIYFIAPQKQSQLSKLEKDATDAQRRDEVRNNSYYLFC